MAAHYRREAAAGVSAQEYVRPGNFRFFGKIGTTGL
jgi:hypothetical protein